MANRRTKFLGLTNNEEVNSKYVHQSTQLQRLAVQGWPGCAEMAIIASC